MKQYIALIAFGLGIISYAQHGPKHGPPSHQHHPHKMEKYHPNRGPHHKKNDYARYDQRGPQRPNFKHQGPRYPQPQPPKSGNGGINVNVVLR